MRPDYERIETLEQELLEYPPRPMGEMRAFVALMDSTGQEASDRLPVDCQVSFTTPGHMSIKILGGPISLIPTRFGSLQPVLIVGDGWMPATHPEWPYEVKPGDTFTLMT